MEQLWNSVLTLLGAVLLGAAGSACFYYARVPAERWGRWALERLRRLVDRGVEPSESEVQKVAAKPGMVAILVGQLVVSHLVLIAALVVSGGVSALFATDVIRSLREEIPPDFVRTVLSVFALVYLWSTCWLLFAKHARMSRILRAVFKHYMREVKSGPHA